MIITINNKKYDVTEFLNDHPGGKDVFIDGADMTAEFNKIGHSKHAIQLLEKYVIKDENITEPCTITNPNKLDIPDTDKIIEQISISFFLYKKSIPILKKLFTHEDYLNLHKILGGLVLCNFIYSIFDLYYSGCKGEFSIRTFKLDFFIFLCIHLILSLSALQFHVPTNGNYTTISIGEEYRLHSILFVIRHITIILVLYFLDKNVFSHSLIIAICLLNMYCVDISSYYYKPKEEKLGLIGSLPFWSGCSNEIQTIITHIYSLAQIYATFILVSSKSNIEVNLFAIIVIQITAFMGTLSKKGLINNFQWHFIYLLQYAITGFLFYKNKNIFSFTNIIYVFIIWTLRTKLNMNKFFLWSCVSTLFLSTYLNKTTTVVSLVVLYGIFNYFGLCFDKKREKNHNIIVSNKTVPTTNLHIIDIKMKNKFDCKPGQYFNLYIDKEKRPYTPISHDISNNSLQFFIKNYGNNKISAKICALKPYMCIHVDGPFGKNFYDINTDTILVNNTEINTKYILMFYCGTGITPFYSILNQIKENTRYKCKLFGSLKDKSENYFDIKQKIFYTYHKLTPTKIHKILQKYNPSNTTILVCGNDNYNAMIFENSKKFNVYKW